MGTKRNSILIANENNHRHIGPCDYCHVVSVLTFEHMVCDSKGGAYASDNFSLICRWCQNSRGNKPMLKWLEELENNDNDNATKNQKFQKISKNWSKEDQQDIYPALETKENKGIVEKYFKMRGLRLESERFNQ